MTRSRTWLRPRPPAPSTVTPALGVWSFTALICAVSLVASAHAARAGVNVWTTHGPYGVYTHALAIDPTTPSTLYAGTESGVFRSTDSGASWNPVNTGLSDSSGLAPSVFALAIDPTAPSTLYAGLVQSCGVGCSGGGAFQSTDSGASWSAVNTGLSDSSGLAPSVAALAIDPTTPSTLYAGTEGQGIFQSTNRGASWTAINTGLTNPQLTALAIDPKTPSTLYAGTYEDNTFRSGGVFKSTNSGGSWTAVNTGLPPGPNGPIVHVLAIDPTTPSTLYAGTFSPYAGTYSGVFKSTNSGGSWTATGLPCRFRKF
jgi:hypothetical protein